ncbi:hypothetical protein ACFXP3_08520, partial [Streptomyces sp. NPDC059096]
MSLISTLARLEATESGRAQPLTTVRHRRISERPLVLVPLTTAGEAGAARRGGGGGGPGAAPARSGGPPPPPG